MADFIYQSNTFLLDDTRWPAEQFAKRPRGKLSFRPKHGRSGGSYRSFEVPLAAAYILRIFALTHFPFLGFENLTGVTSLRFYQS
ncbi:Uncharacterized protein HZ326_25081 [Fusarium oxysporum f. sp. albedinis]|nr:Uncharacterized protein HZ326_25081 [Fusarium oxysporum f. sp. albedinis]